MRILVAEDDDALRSLLPDFLGGLGHAVKGAENGMEPVKMALAERPHAVVTDLHMPELAGGPV